MTLDLAALTQAVADQGAVIRVVVAAVKGSAPREPGAAMLVWRDGQSGTIGGGALEFEAVKLARAQLQVPQPVCVTTQALGPDLGQCCGGAVTLVSELWDTERLTAAEDAPALGKYARRVQPTDRPVPQGALPLYKDGWLVEAPSPSARPIWIHGAGHVGQALARVLAPLEGMAPVLVDADPTRLVAPLAGVETLFHPDPAQLIPHAPADAVHLVMTYSHDRDLALCHAVLGVRHAGIGLIGSATKWARFRKRLIALGHPPAQVDRIMCPIGDPRLGRSPGAIALGIAHALVLGSLSAVDRDWGKRDRA